ncbi:uncharacterized protein LOC117156676 [Bombus vancouverensis nearcticus]|uniref:uncharacterized protein LOC117156676 n=1 Tax=Bombus vancouverensis nearcticus TaxID=2705178 RepID=UPI00402B7E4C
MENFKLDLIYSILQFVHIKYEELRKCRRIVKQEIFQLMEDVDRCKYYKFRTNNGTVSSECKVVGAVMHNRQCFAFTVPKRSQNLKNRMIISVYKICPIHDVQYYSNMKYIRK